MAALTERGTVWDTSPELFDRMMAVNVRAPFFLMQGAVKLMEREKVGGSIVNISSVASYGSVPMLTAYAASKAALNVLTKNVAYSVMRHRIRVNALNLGWMDTPGEDAIQQRYHSGGGDWLARAEAPQPFGRLLKPDEVARAIAFLASDESGMMTGAIVDFDQSVAGAGPQPVPPPMEEWDEVTGVSYSLTDAPSSPLDATPGLRWRVRRLQRRRRLRHTHVSTYVARLRYLLLLARQRGLHHNFVRKAHGCSHFEHIVA